MKKTILFFEIFVTIFTLCAIASISASASPYGKGLYNVNVPYGSQTALSISTSGDISIPITPVSNGALASNTSIITVTSTDVMGYKLYIRALNNTYMDNVGSTLPASANGSPAALATNTWGYNTDASNNFAGITLTDTLIRSISTPAPSGDVTNVKYGIKVDMLKPAGNYVANVVYTAVPQTD